MFLALDVGEETVLGKLAGAQEELRRTGADLTIVARESLHFTVKFLGEIPEGSVPELDARLARLDLKSADLTVAGVGAFPDTKRPRVVWAGIPREQYPRVVPQAEEVIRALNGIGEPEERAFHPHITLARVRSGLNRERLAAFLGANASREFGEVCIRSLKLKSSVLTPAGPSYSVLREYRLV